jgi:6-phospho-beta-glucosidase
MDDYGAWSAIDNQGLDNYCITLYKRFGDRVKYWVSLNEQNFDLRRGFIFAMHPLVWTARRFAKPITLLFWQCQGHRIFRKYVPHGKIGELCLLSCLSLHQSP